MLFSKYKNLFFLKRIEHVIVVQLLSHIRLFVTPWTAARQATLSFTISQSLVKLLSIESVIPSNHLISVVPFSSCLQSFWTSGSFIISALWIRWQSTGASDSASILPMNIQDWFSLGWTAGDSQESSPKPQFKSTSSSAISLLYDPTLTSIHDHWKNHSFH